jgi:low temperature requirement protein LtrA
MSEPAPVHRITTRRRDGEQVTPLELFFDLAFVLAVTQCTTLMAEHPSWRGLAQGLLVLGVLWWAWVGYAWLTSVVDPEAGLVRLVAFLAMAAFLVAALCVPEAFGELALTLAIAYGLVRAAHIALFVIASQDDPNLRSSVTSLGISTSIGVALLVGAAFADGWVQGALWGVALMLDIGGPFLFGAAGWKLAPAHFAERHGLVVLIALGESIVALGVGSEVGVTGPVIATAVVGVSLAAGMWWSYFDVGSVMAANALAAMPVGQQQNEMARDGYSLLHFPIVAGIVLLALGTEHTLAHVSATLDGVAAAALLGGVGLFLAGQIAFKYRVLRLLSRQRVVALALVAAIYPVALAVPAWVTLTIVTAVMWALIAYEVVHYADVRAEVRHPGP